MTYAENTTVPVEKTVSEIVKLIKKAGAQRVAQVEEPDSFAIQFFMADRMIRFRVRLPALYMQAKRGPRKVTVPEANASRAQRHRQRVRALLLVIKAKLESVSSEVETFEEAFLANVVMADGLTIYERIREPIALEYKSGGVKPLLPDYSASRGGRA